MTMIISSIIIIINLSCFPPGIIFSVFIVHLNHFSNQQKAVVVSVGVFSAKRQSHATSEKGIKCIHLDCFQYFYHHKKLLENLQTDHKVQLKRSEHIFPSIIEFIYWKEAEELQNYVY